MVVMTQQRYVHQVVEAWEGEYKKGLLTFWILLSLHDGAKHVREVKYFIESEATTNLEVDEKSVYRSMNRFRKMDLIKYKEVESPNGGPALKVYNLTPIGHEVLRIFYKNNIKRVFITEEFIKRTKGL